MTTSTWCKSSSFLSSAWNTYLGWVGRTHYRLSPRPNRVASGLVGPSNNDTFEGELRLSDKSPKPLVTKWTRAEDLSSDVKPTTVYSDGVDILAP